MVEETVTKIRIPEIPKTTPQSSTCGKWQKKDSDVCPVCKGSGWELYTVSARELEYCYGDNAQDLEYARKCSACSGIKRESFDTTGVPDNCHEADLYKFDFDCYGMDLSSYKKIAFNFLENFKEWQQKGKGIYIFSDTPGSGKTFLACCISKSVMMKYGIRFKFITVPDYIDKVSEGYTLAKQGIPNSPSDIYRDCDLLVLDDIGAQMSKEWQNQELFKLVNSRVGNGLITIYTSNIEVKNLKIDERVKSRINGSTIPLHMPEVSIRDKNTKTAQEDFIRGILSGANN